jgi:ferredoxin
MRVHVDPDLCIGCGICEGDAPDVFSLATSSVAEVIMDPVKPEFEADARMAAEDSPKSPSALKMAKTQIHQRHLARIAQMTLTNQITITILKGKSK